MSGLKETTDKKQETKTRQTTDDVVVESLTPRLVPVIDSARVLESHQRVLKMGIRVLKMVPMTMRLVFHSLFLLRFSAEQPQKGYRRRQNERHEVLCAIWLLILEDKETNCLRAPNIAENGCYQVVLLSFLIISESTLPKNNLSLLTCCVNGY